ncbi:MAG: 3-hydroxyacyl-CoA dehydrogenase/enoyl-CoA hydratase family protein [Deltaproteobacteria bacterium]
MQVGVIGSGSIGPDLAYGFVSAIARRPGAKVFLVDIRQEALDQGLARIDKYLAKARDKGKLNEKAEAAVRAALVPTLSLADLKDCEYVLEAASEDLPIKKKILADLEQVVSQDCLIGFATSGIPRAQIADAAKHPERCFVNHPFYPAWRSPPVEVVLSGDDALGERMMKTLKTLGKVPVVTKDIECFAIDDIFCNYVSEAARIVAEGVATPAQVDAIVNDAIGGGGPLTVMDLTRGNMLVVKCQRLMQNAPHGNDWFAPPKILEETGRWHDRENPGDRKYDDTLAEAVLSRILAVLLARTFFVADEGVCSHTELNWMSRMALGFSKGVLEIADQVGAEKVRELCVAYKANNPGFTFTRSISDATFPKYKANVLVERDGDIGTVRVFRPEVMNALSSRTIAEIDEAFDELLGDDEIKGVVFTSSNGALAGADIRELAALPTAEACTAICMTTHPIMRKFEKAKKPVVAALDGPVMGGGAEFSMACHGRVVGKSLIMSQPEVNLGIIPGYGGTMRLPRLVGVELAAELVRTGRVVKADEAARIGWATEQTVGDVEVAAKRLIRRHLEGSAIVEPVSEAPMEIGELPSVELGHLSRAIDAVIVHVLQDGLTKSLDEGLAVEAEAFGRCRDIEDMQIGMQNFMKNGPRVKAQFVHR